MKSRVQSLEFYITGNIMARLPEYWNDGIKSAGFIRHFTGYFRKIILPPLEKTTSGCIIYNQMSCSFPPPVISLSIECTLFPVF